MKWRVMYQPKSCERDDFVTEDETEYLPLPYVLISLGKSSGTEA